MDRPATARYSNLRFWKWLSLDCGMVPMGTTQSRASVQHRGNGMVPRISQLQSIVTIRIERVILDACVCGLKQTKSKTQTGNTNNVGVRVRTHPRQLSGVGQRCTRTHWLCPAANAPL